MSDEREWVTGLRAGDPTAFDAVFTAYRKRVYGYLVRMTRRADAAEDLLQETFLRLSQHATTLRDDTNLSAWLFTVAHRLVISWARARQVRAQLAGELPADEPAGPSLTPAEALSQSQAQLALERAIANLPEPFREVILLVGVEGMSPSEVADILGIRADLVRQRLARARAQLADHRSSP